MASPLILHVVGARPNFMKIAPVLAALDAHDVRQQLVHTGQHYDPEMSEVFLEQLGMRAPDHHLGIAAGQRRAEQLGAMVLGLDGVIARERPALVVVAGDVTSTLAGAVAAIENDVQVAHVEAGLRSFDWTMPEEHNRRLVDHVSLLCLTHCADADHNLAAEGIAAERILRVGNTMIDSLRSHLPQALARDSGTRLGLEPGGYVLVTLHRPAVVDVPERLGAVLDALDRLAEQLPLVFPLHPRTRARVDALGWSPQRLVFLDPLSYLDFIALEAQARAVLTDSGGIQEETTALGVPCFTFRDSTERPVTCTEGTNTMLGTDPAAIDSILAIETRPGRVPELWDGAAAPRAAEAIAQFAASQAAVVSAR